MLKKIEITNFMLFKHIHLSLHAPYVVVTGETGAGKSLFIQSLQFLSGGKKPTSAPLDPNINTQVACHFDKSALVQVLTACQEPIPDAITACSDATVVIQRVLSPQGKSKMTIAGTPVPSAQVKPIMHALFSINAQHQHLSILDERQQRDILDRYGQHHHLLLQTEKTFQHWKKLQEQQRHYQEELAKLDDLDYLESIQNDLEALGLAEMDLNDLHNQHKMLQSRQTYLHDCQAAHHGLDGDHTHSVASQLHHCQSLLERYTTLYPESTQIHQLLKDAYTLTQEASASLQSALDSDYSADEERLQTIQQQLSQAHDCARKYRVLPDALPELAASTVQSIQQHHDFKDRLLRIGDSIQQAEKDFQLAADALSAAREQSALALTDAIKQQLGSLNLPNAVFCCKVQAHRHPPSATGTDAIHFLFSGNPGIPLEKLADCASGGELARLSLLLSANTPSKHAKVLIFDEADVGVSGKTASLIGKLMHQMAQQHQIICLTHSPQVAAYALQHWHIVKQYHDHSTSTEVHQLDQHAHVQEVARLLSGMDVTEESLASAKRLCEQSATKFQGVHALSAS
jgi:DNA repair protein RecN (Recombination protein N)